MSCYNEKETLFILDCIDFVIDNDMEFMENTVIEAHAHHTPLFQLREKVLNNLTQLKDEDNPCMETFISGFHD